MQGQLDSPLTPRGREQMLEAARLLERLGVDEILASPLGRVRASVEIVNARLKVPVRFDDRLKEWSAGDWSGELYADIQIKWPDDWALWEADRLAHRSPGGENFLDLRDRAEAFVADVAGHDLAARVAIIAHGYINRALAGALLREPPARTLGIRQTNDTMIRIGQEGERVETDHFVSGAGPFPGLPESDRTAAPA
jgi:broad specificity phosphatase PhoE